MSLWCDSLTNQPFTVLGGPSVKQWHLLPPGHFIAGKHARVHQYALTPQQLHEREVRVCLMTKYQNRVRWDACPAIQETFAGLFDCLIDR